MQDFSERRGGEKSIYEAHSRPFRDGRELFIVHFHSAPPPKSISLAIIMALSSSATPTESPLITSFCCGT